MGIDSTSTIRDVKAAYYDSVDYDLVASSDKAQTFITACRQLLVRLSKRIAHGGRAEEIEIDPTVLERQIIECKRWLLAQAANAAGVQSRVFSRGEYFLPTYPGPYYG
jgi:hypothetical protein